MKNTYPLTITLCENFTTAFSKRSISFVQKIQLFVVTRIRQATQRRCLESATAVMTHSSTFLEYAYIFTHPFSRGIYHDVKWDSCKHIYYKPRLQVMERNPLGLTYDLITMRIYESSSKIDQNIHDKHHIYPEIADV